VQTYPYAVALSQESDDDGEISARWDIPYNVAAFLLWGRLDAEAFDGMHRHNPHLRSLMKRVEVRVGKSFADPVVRGARVVVRLNDGRKLEGTCDVARWDEADPPSDEELEEKFRALASGCLAERDVDSLVEHVWNLEECTNVQAVTEILACPDRVPVRI
jgi:2-methylcitrate dehydratase